MQHATVFAGFLITLFLGCSRSLDPVAESADEITGTWVHQTYTDGIRILTRSNGLEEDNSGYIFFESYPDRT